MTTSQVDRRHGFEFWQGIWRTRNRRLADMLDPQCQHWVEFDSHCLALSAVAGTASFDTFVAEVPDRGHVEAMTVRLFRPETGTWRIWWVSTTNPGELGVPVEGSWQGDVGLFHAEEELGGRHIGVRFEWTRLSDRAARWRQFFSYDGGQSWKINWIMEHSRVE